MICPTCENIQEIAGPCQGSLIVDDRILPCSHIFLGCISCLQPLGPSEISAGVDYHWSCKICVFCRGEINEQVINSCRRVDRPFSHNHCWINHQQEEISKRPITLLQGHLDYLNAFRLMVEPKLDIEVETNQKDAEIQFESYRRIHEMSYDEIFKFGKRCEAVAAACMLILADKKKERKLELQKKDVEKIQAHVATRESEQRKTEVKKLNKLPDINALRKLGIDPIEAQRIVLKEKAIAAKISIGMTREQAITDIEAASGKSVQ